MSSSSSSEERKLNDGVLGRDSGCKGSRQLELFEVEMVAVREGMMPKGKLDLLLCLVLSKGQTLPLRSRVQDTRRVYTS